MSALVETWTPETVGALFAGAGGLELGLNMVWPDAHPVWFSQYEPPTKSYPRPTQAPSKVLAHRWPGVPNHGDITAIDWTQVEPVDVLTGGFPCQDVSHAGKRAGLKDGTRSGLWSVMRDAIDTLRPRLVVAENVRGLLSAEANGDVEQCAWCVGGAADGEPPLRALGAVLGDLADIGYDAAWVGLRASDVGAAHGRFRVFVLAWQQGDAAALTWQQGDAAALLPTPVVNDMGAGKTVEWWDEWTARLKGEHGNGNGHGASLSIEALRLLPTPMTEPDTGNGHARNLGKEVRLLPTPTVSDTNGAGEHGDGGLDLRTAISLLPTPRATDDLMLPSAVALMPTPSVADADGGHATRSGARSGELLLPGLVRTLLPTPTVSDHKASGGNPDTTGSHGTTLTDATVRQPDQFAQYGPAIRRWETILGRPAPSPTEPTGKNGAHRLSARFDEFLMGWPDGWASDVPGVSGKDVIRMCGNGVVPQQCAEALWWLLEVRADALAGRWAA